VKHLYGVEGKMSLKIEDEDEGGKHLLGERQAFIMNNNSNSDECRS